MKEVTLKELIRMNTILGFLEDYNSNHSEFICSDNKEVNEYLKELRVVNTRRRELQNLILKEGSNNEKNN